MFNNGLNTKALLFKRFDLGLCSLFFLLNAFASSSVFNNGLMLFMLKKPVLFRVVWSGDKHRFLYLCVHQRVYRLLKKEEEARLAGCSVVRPEDNSNGGKCFDRRLILISHDETEMRAADRNEERGGEKQRRPQKDWMETRGREENCSQESYNTAL